MSRRRNKAKLQRQYQQRAGQPPVRHADTFSSSVLGIGTRAIYYTSDEAVRKSRADAAAMERDVVISTPLRERIDATALKSWRIEPEDKSDPAQKLMAAHLEQIISRTPNFLNYRQALLHAVFHGKYGITNTYNWDKLDVRVPSATGALERQRRQVIRITDWYPVHGDKLVFDLTGCPGVRVNRTLLDTGTDRSKIQSTVEGDVYFLDGADRQYYVINKHKRIDGPVEDVRMAGAIHGWGLRADIYWQWYHKNTVLTHLEDSTDRYASGVHVYWYREGDEDSRNRQINAAKNQNYTNALVLGRSDDSTKVGEGYEFINSKGDGLQYMLQVVQNFENKIHTAIVGQDMGSKAVATGLGSEGIADFQRETKSNIISVDAITLQETLTTDLVEPLRRANQQYFPEWPDACCKFVIELDEPDVLNMIEAAKILSDMGVLLDMDHLVDLAGLKKAKTPETSTTPTAPSTPAV